ncbi:hypothetical protein HBI55_199630 [Parastagonospora nodorum]|nr:hypothetical protein HBI74_113200 [Parastagonospora nodorum]KAH5213850.1 hypothetical protein HBH68_064780 [Parastagonospora nodorum]KAH6485740.1 hypothetical protein HBI55_199630 [Parastagonospora nodorum]
MYQPYPILIKFSFSSLVSISSQKAEQSAISSTAQRKIAKGDTPTMATTREQLIEIWKSVPKDVVEMSPEVDKEEERLMKVFESFVKACESCKSSIQTAFDEITNRENRHYPWENPIYTPEGKEWAVRLSLAALELPGFLKETHADRNVHANAVRAEIQRVMGVWTDSHPGLAFEAAKQRAIIV